MIDKKTKIESIEQFIRICKDSLYKSGKDYHDVDIYSIKADMVDDIKKMLFFKENEIHSLLNDFMNNGLKTKGLDYINWIFEFFCALVQEEINLLVFKQKSFPGLANYVKKLYEIKCKYQSECKEYVHKGLELHNEAILNYLEGNINYGIELMTLSFIDDAIAWGSVEEAKKSNAYKFLATRVYDNMTAIFIADKIKQQINTITQQKKVDLLKDKGGIERIPYPRLIMEDKDQIDFIPYETAELFRLDREIFSSLFTDLKENHKRPKKPKIKTLIARRDATL